MDRRAFGRRLLEVGAALGLRSIGGTSLSALGLSLGACEGALGSQGDPLPRVAKVGQAIESVIIVGSGYGSAVAALRLTERGIPVTMLEMGRLWNKPDADGLVFCSATSPDGRAMWFKDRVEAVIKQISFLGIPIPIELETPVQAGIIDVTGPESMRVSRGRGVGGGSLVNMSVFVMPERDVLERTLPTVDVDELLDVYYPRAKKHLRASQVPEELIDDEVYRYARVAMTLAESVGYKTERVTSGYDYDYMKQELEGKVPKSATGGEAGFGNNYGKASLDKTYLADAMGTGLLTILPLHEVLRIRQVSSGGYELEVKEIDIDGNVLSHKTLPCSHLFLGAGSMGTSELLVRARERGDLPDLDLAVGTKWGPNSDIFVALDNPIWMPTGMTQATIPGAAFRAPDGDGKHTFTMVNPLPFGFENFMTFFITMTESPEAGHFVYDRVADTVELKWAAEQSEPAVKSARYIFDKINRANGTSYHAGGMFGGPLLGDRATYHPVGGCPLGEATDDYGRMAPYPGLYVMDSSLIPVGLGANPALTVTALAERNIERILAEDFA